MKYKNDFIIKPLINTKTKVAFGLTAIIVVLINLGLLGLVIWLIVAAIQWLQRN